MYDCHMIFKYNNIYYSHQPFLDKKYGCKKIGDGSVVERWWKFVIFTWIGVPVTTNAE